MFWVDGEQARNASPYIPNLSICNTLPESRTSPPPSLRSTQAGRHRIVSHRPARNGPGAQHSVTRRLAAKGKARRWAQSLDGRRRAESQIEWPSRGHVRAIGVLAEKGEPGSLHRRPQAQTRSCDFRCLGVGAPRPYQGRGGSLGPRRHQSKALDCTGAFIVHIPGTSEGSKIRAELLARFTEPRSAWTTNSGATFPGLEWLGYHWDAVESPGSLLS
ncbi:hypothetical protein C8Q77DRAFT_98970 [Trametes polyzona]|nr:hypothetical protein C8Q77DRAFT_98970 [Trametes polyzona]